VRKGLVVFQFVISVFMIVSTLIIYRQMKFLQEKDLGFDKEQVLAIKLYGDLKEKVLANTAAFKSELQRHAAISAVSLVSRLPGERLGNEPLVIKGLPEAANIRYMWADESLLPTLNIKLAAGRNFFKHTSDFTTAFILNEAAVNVLALKDPVGLQAAYGNSAEAGPIVGVVKNFNFASLHTAVEPLVIQYKPAWAEYLLLKIKGNNLPETLSFLKEKINTTAPNSLFVFSFLDENLNALYQSESRMSNIFKTFAAFTILISCLGLFGLSAYSAEQRTKEIGIRKVLGASVTGIVALLSKDFLKLVILANVLAWPLAWWVMHQWLQNFEYRTDINWWLFALAGVAALIFALATVCFQAVKAAVANPVNSLRNE
jgi:putative ABC transport system permease protein